MKIKDFFKWIFTKWHFWLVVVLDTIWGAVNVDSPTLPEFVGIFAGSLVYIFLLYGMFRIFMIWFTKNDKKDP